MERVTVLYSGRVQGVGFRFTVRQLACGYLKAFLEGIAASELSGFIAKEHETWQPAQGNLRGFAIGH
jgi:acylphosphatase